MICPKLDEQTFSSVNKAIDLDPNDPEAHRILGSKILFLLKVISREIIEICPSDTLTSPVMRFCTLLFGESQKAMEQIKR